MIKNVNPNISAQKPDLAKYIKNRTRTEFKSVSKITYDKIEISKEARDASKIPPNIDEESDDPIEQILEEYNNSLSFDRTNETDDAAAAERKKKLMAMKIAMRIANGDNVPMQDHRFLAEYDSKLYMAAMKASLTADNKDPKDYDSLVDEMFAEENAGVNVESQDDEIDAESETESLDNNISLESVDVYS